MHYCNSFHLFFTFIEQFYPWRRKNSLHFSSGKLRSIPLHVLEYTFYYWIVKVSYSCILFLFIHCQIVQRIYIFIIFLNKNCVLCKLNLDFSGKNTVRDNRTKYVILGRERRLFLRVDTHKCFHGNY